MKYLLERGVGLEFATKTLRVKSAQMWYPYADLVVATKA